MKGLSMISIDLLQKKMLSEVIGGSTTEKKCACICFGPLIPEEADDEDISQPDPEDGDCSDCGKTNAFRAIMG
ncbi:MAG: hypothetical protein HDS10_00130 [Bacteroides sp.]|nr:hypothetical protein [Bacteroides sp.]